MGGCLCGGRRLTPSVDVHAGRHERPGGACRRHASRINVRKRLLAPNCRLMLIYYARISGWLAMSVATLGRQVLNADFLGSDTLFAEVETVQTAAAGQAAATYPASGGSRAAAGRSCARRQCPSVPTRGAAPLASTNPRRRQRPGRLVTRFLPTPQVGEVVP